MARAYDLVVIGSGTAAQVASHRIASACWKVAVIDHRPFGGTCALRGCDPKKMLVTGAQVMDDMSRMSGRGVVAKDARISPFMVSRSWSKRASIRSDTRSSPCRSECR
jgi:glutathione reductase (NADPH)